MYDHSSITEALVCRTFGRLVEIVADADREILLRYGHGTESQTGVIMNLTEAVQELQAVAASTPNRSLWQHLASTIVPKGIPNKSLW